MSRTTTLFATLMTTTLLAFPAVAGPQSQTPEAKIEQAVSPLHTPRIQIALLLDTSNSMDGLIAQAKSQLWMLVNELSEGERGGVKPEIELALYEYGNSNISVAKGYVRQVLPLTTDLDAVSEKLFSLKTDGGQEYAGQVIDTALDELEWGNRDGDMKLIIIAGNEPFTQGPVHYETACAQAKRKGVIIDTIHCGAEQTGIDGKWKAGADCGGGIYMTINQDEQAVHVPTPYDAQIVDLNKKLNDTYIGYGSYGSAYKLRQEEQDANAAAMSPEISIQRSKSKISSGYKNSSWDLVDAYKDDKEKILELDEDALPDELKGMNKAERKAFIETKDAERTDLQAQIKELQDKRDAIVAEKRKEMAKTKTLDNVLVGAVRKQAKEQGYGFENTN